MVVDPPSDTDPPPVNPEPAVTVSAPLLTNRALGSVPATSAVFRSTALLEEPEPINMDEVKVFETIASVTELLGNDNAPEDRVNPLSAVSSPQNWPLANRSIWLAT